MTRSDHHGALASRPTKYKSRQCREPEGGRAGDTLVLDPFEREHLVRLAAALDAEPTREPERFCREAAVAAKELPTSIWSVLRGFARTGTDSSVLVIDGLPLESELPPTPADNKSHMGERTLAARAQAIINHAIGEMVAYEAEGDGRLFQDMVPSPAAAETQTSLSSKVELELHTEQAFSELRPDWVSLACLRGAADAQTYVLAARDLVRIFSSDEIALLRESLWTTGVDESFRVGGQVFLLGDLRGPFAILAGADDDPLVRFDQDLDWGISARAHDLRERIIEAYPRLRRSFVLKPGQMLLIDNHRGIHGRSPFQARFDGADRFIVRSFVVRDLIRSRHARLGDSRVIAARCS